MSNGVHHQNGGLGEDGAAASSAQRGAPPEFLGPRQLINRHEYIRLLQQSLHRLGFSEAAHRLERDSVRPAPSSLNDAWVERISGTC